MGIIRLWRDYVAGQLCAFVTGKKKNKSSFMKC